MNILYGVARMVMSFCRALAAHKDDAVHIHHFRRAYHLRIDKAREQYGLILDERQHIAHHIAAACGFDLFLKVALRQYFRL